MENPSRPAWAHKPRAGPTRRGRQRDANWESGMTTEAERRTVLQVGAAMLGGAMLPASVQAQGTAAHEFMVKDIVYQSNGGKERLARLYQPAGRGPFPAVLQVHGGAWNNKDRTDGQNTALDLAAAGIVVLSIDFRNAPEA